MNDVIGSIGDIDAKLDAEFGTVANEPDETLVDDNNETNDSVEEPVVETTEVQEGTTNEDEEPQQDNSSNVDESAADTVADDKKDTSKDHHAFSDLRAQNSTLKKEKQALEADSNFLKELAASYGYTDVSAFQKAVKDARMQKEAEAKGYDPELYRKSIEQQERIAALEKQREQDLMDRKIERFKGALDNAASLYGVTQDEIFDRLEKSGLSAENILDIPNPKLLIDGLLVDKIQARAKQNQINEQNNMKGLVEDKNEDGGVDKTITIESLLKDDLAKYKADNFLD